MACQHGSGSFIDPNPIGVETSMASQHENGADIYLNLSGVETHDEEVKKFQALGCADPIEEDVEDITLKGSSLAIEENGVKDDCQRESESSESESANSDSESSSDSDRGSSSSSSDSEDDDDVEVEEGEVNDSDEEKMVSWSMVDDDEDGDDVGGPIKSKNELQNLPPVPPVDATLEPHHQMLPVGIVTSIVGAQVIVEGVETHDPLNEGSILWLTESRKPLGLVDEIFGPVKNPFYIVRYNSESEVPDGIHGETLVSFVPEFAAHVLNNKDLYKKGYDASGANDEELSDEMEFSDDEQEAEYKRMREMTKRGVNEQNHINRKKNRKKFLPREHKARATPAAPLPDHGNCPPSFPYLNAAGTGQVPSFPHLNAAPNFTPNGVWTNGTAFPQQLQSSAMLPNGLPANGMPWFPQNTQISPQLPMQGVPFFQQQLHPNQGSLSTTMQPGMQSNMFGQSMYATGLGQNQMTFGMGLPFSQMQPPIFAAQQGFPSTELHSNTILGARPQFHPRPSANRGRKTFHGAGRRGGRPAN
uniref:H/ACA ribonucleoprotein complex non-core subunit NAF1 n=1 Tax=Cajanus cajan TaxID=3821 RepID=A0A151TP86_CAJCA|nr:H/ACA ribonucleoprotein complex non-core subunit NAF1 [Cajanus cajan]